MEIAIPLIALGGMYVVSNQSNESCAKKEIRQQRQENFANMGIRSNIPTNQSEKYGNYLPNTVSGKHSIILFKKFVVEKVIE
jgi:hypothetical protein